MRAITLEAVLNFVLATHSPYIVGDQDPGAGGLHLVLVGPAASAARMGLPPAALREATG